MVLSVVVATAAPAHAAGNRDWLRPGCVWDATGNWVQRCQVPSPAHGHDMTVLIQPGLNAGGGGLYLLDGLEAPQDSNYWATTSAMQQFLGDNVTLVMPTGGGGQFYADWEMAGQPLSSGVSPSEFLPPLRHPKWETFLTAELPGWLQANFGVSPHRNSIVGISMGALPALTLAARHPGQFKQSIALSGFIDPAMLTHIPMISSIWFASALFGGGQIWEMWGVNPVTFSTSMNNADPVAMVQGLRGVDTIVYSGNGIKPPHDIYPNILNAPLAIIGEFLINASTHSFVAKARAQGVNVEHQTGLGIHTWQAWLRQLEINHGRILGAVG